jgi:DnaK suppressor protein
MNKVFLQKMKENLLSQKRDITLRSSQSTDIDTEGDETDEIQANMIMELVNRLSSRDNFRITRINDALQKIAANTYGLCEDCGENIPEKRLLANPHFLTCVACAEDRELEEKQRKRS